MWKTWRKVWGVFVKRCIFEGTESERMCLEKEREKGQLEGVQLEKRQEHRK